MYIEVSDITKSVKMIALVFQWALRNNIATVSFKKLIFLVAILIIDLAVLESLLQHSGSSSLTRELNSRPSFTGAQSLSH